MHIVNLLYEWAFVAHSPYGISGFYTDLLESSPISSSNPVSNYYDWMTADVSQNIWILATYKGDLDAISVLGFSLS